VEDDKDRKLICRGLIPNTQGRLNYNGTKIVITKIPVLLVNWNL